jgi:hypothetical protein
LFAGTYNSDESKGLLVAARAARAWIRLAFHRGVKGMPTKDIDTSAAVYPMRNRGTAAGKAAPVGPTKDDGAASTRARQPEVHIERVLQIDAGRGMGRIGIEALEGLLAEIGADDALTLRLALDDEAPVRLGLALASGEAERQQALAAALDLATALINTERRA